ncbi:MAG: gluconokinase [Bacteroidota bacterium]
MASGTRIYVLMGVSGAGKTFIGKKLSEKSGWPFFEGDDFHPKANVEKMRQGQPLNDEDRVPWLLELRKQIETQLENGTTSIIACSALKAAYREVLQRDDRRVRFILLHGAQELLAKRLAEREHAYMPSSLLPSQLETLEIPEDVLTLDVAEEADSLIEQVLAYAEAD